MSINLSFPKASEVKPRITVFGVGGAGGNAVNNMIASSLQGVDFVVGNTDAQALSYSTAERCIQIGASVTDGLGAGSRPEIGSAAAEESLAEIQSVFQGAHMVFVTAGMGGGTGTGAAPVIARAAREQNILTVGVVTKPFQFEGKRRLDIAEAGIIEMQQYVDTLIIIPNQNLFRLATEKTTFADAFAMADEVLHSGVAGITDLMVRPGHINLDFADVRSVMNEMGKAMMGTGEAAGDNRAVTAAEMAISNPLLDEVSMKGARGLLINITGNRDMTLYEVDEAANRIREEVDETANIIIGSTFDDALEGVIRISVVATGITPEEMREGASSSAYSHRPVALHGVGGRSPTSPAPSPQPPAHKPQGTSCISGYPAPDVASGVIVRPPSPPPPPPSLAPPSLPIVTVSGNAQALSASMAEVNELDVKEGAVTAGPQGDAETIAPFLGYGHQHEEIESEVGSAPVFKASKQKGPDAEAETASVESATPIGLVEDESVIDAGELSTLPESCAPESSMQEVAMAESKATIEENITPHSLTHMMSPEAAGRKWGLLERFANARRGWQKPSPELASGQVRESVPPEMPEATEIAPIVKPFAIGDNRESKSNDHSDMETAPPSSFDYPRLDEEHLEIPAFLRRPVS